MDYKIAKCNVIIKINNNIALRDLIIHLRSRINYMFNAVIADTDIIVYCKGQFCEVVLITWLWIFSMTIKRQRCPIFSGVIQALSVLG